VNFALPFVFGGRKSSLSIEWNNCVLMTYFITSDTCFFSANNRLSSI
jgi:hypothetical protein